MSGEFVAAVLARIESDLAELPAADGDAGWRGRVADATALLRASRVIEARRRAAERLLHDDPELPPAPRIMEVV